MAKSPTGCCSSCWRSRPAVTSESKCPAALRRACDRRIANRTFLTDTFVDLFEGTSVETHIREQFAAGARDAGPKETSDGRDFRGEVEAWLERVLG